MIFGHLKNTDDIDIENKSNCLENSLMSALKIFSINVLEILHAYQKFYGEILDLVLNSMIFIFENSHIDGRNKGKIQIKR